MKKIVLGITILAQCVMADYNPHLSQIKSIYSYDKGAVVQLSENFDKSTCKRKDRVFISASTSKGAYTMLMSAYMSGKKIRIGYHPSKCDTIWGGMSKAYSVLIY